MTEIRVPRLVIGGTTSGVGRTTIAAGLMANEPMRREILEAARDGMPIYAECGGLMYLTEAIVDFDGAPFPMVGAVPGRAVMERGRLRIGYVEVEPLRENILARPGTRLRGHEFHCARWDDSGFASPAYRILSLDGRQEGYQRDNLLATFVHLHLATDPSLAGRFVAPCDGYRPSSIPSPLRGEGMDEGRGRVS